MSNSLSEQLLKAGLITQDQLDQAALAKQQQKEQAKARQQPKPAGGKPKPFAKGKPHTAKPKAESPSPASTQSVAKEAKSTPPNIKKPRPGSDLEQFYRERDSIERQEREAEEQRRREKAERKKQTRQQVKELINAHLINTEDASIRYNFVVGDTVKYLFVTEEQRKALAEGQLAITFLEGRRCLIPLNIADQIHALDPDKLVVINQGGEDELAALLDAIEANQARESSELSEASESSASSAESIAATEPPATTQAQASDSEPPASPKA